MGRLLKEIIRNVALMSLRNNDGDYGLLVPIEENIDIPFAIKRVYYISKVPSGIERGFHAHKKLEQVLICVNGSVSILVDNGKEKTKVFLDDPKTGLYVGNKVWREMHDFSEGSVLLVLASELYTEEDYIRDYDDFLEAVLSKA